MTEEHTSRLTPGRSPSLDKGGQSGSEQGLCQYVRQVQAAICLIRLGARASVAGQLTGLEKKTTKRLYQQLMGEPSPPGQLPYSDNWFLRNDRRQFHITLIWHLYHRFAPRTGSRAWVLIDTFETYLQWVQEPLLDLHRTAHAIQLFTSGLWVAHCCRVCNLVFPAPLDNNQHTCPCCRQYQWHLCKRCGLELSLKLHGVGRRRCPGCGSSLS